MTRLEKKCIVGSASLHGMLLLVFLFSSAFFTSKKKQQTLHVVTIMGAIPTDRLISTGGSPKGSPTPPAPAPAAPVQPPTPPPQPPPPKPEPVKPEPVKSEPVKQETVVKKPEPPKQAQKIAPKPAEKPLAKADFVAKPTKPTTKPKEKPEEAPAISTTVVKRKVDTGKQQREREERERAERAEQERKDYLRQLAAYERSQKDLANKFNSKVDGVGKDVGQGTDVTPLGDGGIAYVHYGSLIREVYDRAWTEPPSLTDDNGIVKARITIARNGQVMSAKIVGKSGIPALDKSVERVLREVRFVSPFPAETTDAERTFTINFNLKAKRMST